MEKVACPLATVPDPIWTPPSKKVTVPVAASGSTLAAKITNWPELDGFGVEPKARLELALFVVCVKIEEVLPL